MFHRLKPGVFFWATSPCPATPTHLWLDLRGFRLVTTFSGRSVPWIIVFPRRSIFRYFIPFKTAFPFKMLYVELFLQRRWLCNSRYPRIWWSLWAAAGEIGNVVLRLSRIPISVFIRCSAWVVYRRPCFMNRHGVAIFSVAVAEIAALEHMGLCCKLPLRVVA